MSSAAGLNPAVGRGTYDVVAKTGRAADDKGSGMPQPGLMALRTSHAHRRHARREVALTLLPTFFLATIVMVLAIVVMAAVDSDVADACAFVLLLVTLGVLMAGINRQLGDGDSDDER